MFNVLEEEMQQRYKKYLIVFIVLLLGMVLLSPLRTSAAASSPYLIKVNRQQNCITIYKKDKKGKHTIPVKSMICSTGGKNTPLGTFKTPVKYRWKLLNGNVWGQYSTRIHGGILFHSVWYYTPDASKLSATQYNNLGKSVSAGCIRLTVEDAKWIYDNCPIGTTVTIYDGKSPGPLGKPKAITLPTNTGWDPTDPSPLNPWRKSKPVISGARNQTVKYGNKVNLRKGVTAKTSVGIYNTNALKVKGKVNSKKPGKYKVTYSIKDEINRLAKKTVTFTVLQSTAKPKLKGVKNQTVDERQKINKAFALKNVTATWNGKKINNKIKVAITKESDTRYKIEYKVAAENKKTASMTSIITVKYTVEDAIIITGTDDLEVTSDVTIDETFAREGVSAYIEGADPVDITDQIQVSISELIDGEYIITYQVNYKNYKEVIKTRTVKVLPSI